MSLDFPDRAKWLAVRATPRKRQWRWFHVAKRLIPVRQPDDTVTYTVELIGSTYRRNNP